MQTTNFFYTLAQANCTHAKHWHEVLWLTQITVDARSWQMFSLLLGHQLWHCGKAWQSQNPRHIAKPQIKKTEITRGSFLQKKNHLFICFWIIHFNKPAGPSKTLFRCFIYMPTINVLDNGKNKQNRQCVQSCLQTKKNVCKKFIDILQERQWFRTIKNAFQPWRLDAHWRPKKICFFHIVWNPTIFWVIHCMAHHPLAYTKTKKKKTKDQVSLFQKIWNDQN